MSILDPETNVDDLIRQIRYEIRYEEAPGIHTYHHCPYCQKHRTRAGKCADCLKKELEDLTDAT
jgi:hypothetical protein